MFLKNCPSPLKKYNKLLAILVKKIFWSNSETSVSKLSDLPFYHLLLTDTVWNDWFSPSGRNSNIQAYCKPPPTMHRVNKRICKYLVLFQLYDVKNKFQFHFLFSPFIFFYAVSDSHHTLHGLYPFCWFYEFFGKQFFICHWLVYFHKTVAFLGSAQPASIYRNVG